MMKKEGVRLFRDIYSFMTERIFLKEMDMTKEEMKAFLAGDNWQQRAESFLDMVDERGRFRSPLIAEAVADTLASFDKEPEEGWLKASYNHVLWQLFPEKCPPEMAAISNEDIDSEGSKNLTGQCLALEGDGRAKGCIFLLQLLKALYSYEHRFIDFDPTMDMHFLTMEEVETGGYTKEYKRFLRLTRSQCVYEFMRIGIETTPYNTLGHIAGVHYVAMHVARQLASLKVPVDLALVSGAAAGHDIGKYGCKQSEERRIPYLHYYYTDICFNRFKMPMIGHIAANHSTWDLELENLSVESLILIYADFKVKSSRNQKGEEIVHFYSLAEAFDVILAKLDNVDAAKELRYRKVYNKLKNFEDYMIDLGVNVELPEIPRAVPTEPVPAHSKDFALLSKREAVWELKYAALEHNIKLMNKFYREDDFANLLETARSEKQWKNVRTYVSIFEEYSTYMTERQKLMTLRFLYEMLAHKESDIRNQAGEVIGQIIAKFNEEYKKELPQGVQLPAKKVTNLSLWESYLESILMPDHRLTEQHKKWIENSLKDVTGSLLGKCRADMRPTYLDELLKWYAKPNLTKHNKETLLRTAIVIKPAYCTEDQINQLVAFAQKILAEEEMGLQIAAGNALAYYGRSLGHKDEPQDEFSYRRELKLVLGLNPNQRISKETLSEMYLDNLKARTPWTIKVANISLMLEYLHQVPEEALHVATHLGNLAKVSETVTVRRAAGEGLLSIIGKMPLEQRNEIAVEMGKGLEIGDYQFSKYIPNYLGVIMLYLPPLELDELMADLEKLLDGNSSQVASAVLHTFGVMLENYRIYRGNFGTIEPAAVTDDRKYKLVNLLLKGFANFNKTISEEALWTIGVHVFGSAKLTLEEKYELFGYCHKKLLTLYEYAYMKEQELDFFHNAAVLNHIYRFICQYEVEAGAFNIPELTKVAFFPGTFDPFSLSHKAIATEIRDMGYEVYLALDEFSWSKKTQPRLQRRKIMSMSVADQENIYIFPDDIPVNIANPRDLKHLKEIFKGRDLYFVAGSDVIENASCYSKDPTASSHQSFQHIVFKRSSVDTSLQGAVDQRTRYPISGSVITLHLEEYYEDISSTRIRENIDLNRDISNLIDPVAQNYISKYSLYLREPAYKHVLQARDIQLEDYCNRGSEILADMAEELTERGYNLERVGEYLKRDDVRTVVIRDGMLENKVVAIAAVKRLDSIDLLSEFKDQDIAAYIRNKSVGAIAVIGGLFFSKKTSITSLGQTILIEVLSELLARDYTYVVYNPCDGAGLSGREIETLEKQGFINIATSDSKSFYAVDMKSPAIIFKNVDTIVKSPLSKNPKVLKAVEDAHNRLLRILTSIYPGELVLSYNAGIMHHKMINLIARLNGVSPVPAAEKKYGPYMAVPFGKVLEQVAVPNTVTKALHTEKYFARDVSTFTIEEESYYSSLDDQVKTIKSFNRPVILVDDLLHKGYRMREIDPILKENQVDVVETVVGVQTGRGRDLMTVKERSVDSAYFLPNLKCWIDETAVYPYLGGDGIKDKEISVESQGMIPSLNMILPYTIPTFLGNLSGKSLYDYSMTCLENARDILKTLEEEYQDVFERKLTLKRLGEVITAPKRPDLGNHIQYDENVAASAYVEKDIERLIRLQKMFR